MSNNNNQDQVIYMSLETLRDVLKMGMNALLKEEYFQWLREQEGKDDLAFGRLLVELREELDAAQRIFNDED